MAIRINMDPESLNKLRNVTKRQMEAVQKAICKELGLPCFSEDCEHGDRSDEGRSFANEVYLAMDWPTFIDIK